MAPQDQGPTITVGVLALQGAFSEHVQLLRAATTLLPSSTHRITFDFPEIRTPAALSTCDALILPGGESTTISLVASRSALLEPLRDFVKVARKPVWGTCAGLILLAESANRTKKGGQELVGGLDVRVRRNHFGRQVESFQVLLRLGFLDSGVGKGSEVEVNGNGVTGKEAYRCVFIRAPVVEKILPHKKGIQEGEAAREETVVAPSKTPADQLAREQVRAEVEVLATLPRREKIFSKGQDQELADETTEDIIAVRQGNVFGCSFHPELTEDARIHAWWLGEVVKAVQKRRQFDGVEAKE